MGIKPRGYSIVTMHFHGNSFAKSGINDMQGNGEDFLHTSPRFEEETIISGSQTIPSKEQRTVGVMGFTASCCQFQKSKVHQLCSG